MVDKYRSAIGQRLGVELPPQDASEAWMNSSLNGAQRAFALTCSSARDVITEEQYLEVLKRLNPPPDGYRVALQFGSEQLRLDELRAQSEAHYQNLASIPGVDWEPP